MCGDVCWRNGESRCVQIELDSLLEMRLYGAALWLRWCGVAEEWRSSSVQMKSDLLLLLGEACVAVAVAVPQVALWGGRGDA